VSVSERIPDRNVWRIYLTTFALGLAYGMAISVLAVFLAARGFTKREIGSLAAWFAAGIVALSIPMGGLIRRFSARATLAASLGGYAVCIGAFPFLSSYAAVAGVRFFDGACSVGIWVSSETILLARARADHKAFTTSLYAISLAVGYVVGPLLARLLVAAVPLPFAFVTAAALSALACSFVLLRLERDPPALDARDAQAKTHVWEILRRIKSSCFATFAYGYFQASVVLFLPLYLIESKGIVERDTVVIPAFFAAGMLVFSNVAGRLGDRHGHLLVMRLLACVGLTMILGFAFLESFALMCGAVFVAGATLASISPVSLALQGVVTEPTDYSRATAIYNAFYAAGMLLGPPVSSRLFEAMGGATMLHHLAALWAAFVGFTLIFFRDDPAVFRRRRGVLAARP
jgi:MFS family permease